eukprot:317441-Prymnesium_polylepis.1
MVEMVVEATVLEAVVVFAEEQRDGGDGEDGGIGGRAGGRGGAGEGDGGGHTRGGGPQYTQWECTLARQCS